MVTCFFSECRRYRRRSDCRDRTWAMTLITTGFFSVWRRSSVLAKAAILSASSYMLDRTQASIRDGSSKSSKRLECCNRVRRLTRCFSERAAREFSRFLPGPSSSSCSKDSWVEVTADSTDSTLVKSSARDSSRARPRRSTLTKVAAWEAHSDWSSSSAASKLALAASRSSTSAILRLVVVV